MGELGKDCLVLTVERRYLRYRNGYYVCGAENSAFFSRYLDAFSCVFVLARVEDVVDLPSRFEKVDSDTIKFIPAMTSGVGVGTFGAIYRFLRKQSKVSLIVRSPGFFSCVVLLSAVLARKGYSMEVVAEPSEELGYVTEMAWFNFLLKLIFVPFFRFSLRSAMVASFVTKKEIQVKNLSQKNIYSSKYSSSYSSISLLDSFFCSKSEFRRRTERFVSSSGKKLLLVGALDRPFKGVDVLIDILVKLPDIYSADVAGDGRLRRQYESYAKERGVEHRIRFLGYVSGVEKKELFGAADIFVLCSRREGLPRVVIEAMASGLVCVCSKVSGVSELVEDRFVYGVNDVAQASEIICSINIDDVTITGRENINRARYYSDKNLSRKRGSFFKMVRRLNSQKEASKV